MSIILDALKKAGEKKTPGDESSSESAVFSDQHPETSRFGFDKSPFGIKLNLKDLRGNQRVVILGGVVLVLFLALVIFGNPFAGQVSGGDENPSASGAAPVPPPVDLTTQLVQKQVAESLEEAKKLRLSAIQNFKEGNLQESIQNYAKLTLLASTDAEIYNNYGVALRKSGQIEESRESYQKALALKPDYPEALNNLAVIYMWENKYNKAKELLLRAIEINPDYVDPYFHLAISLEKNGQIEEAVKYYDKFLELSVGRVNRTVRLQVEERLSKLKQ